MIRRFWLILAVFLILPAQALAAGWSGNKLKPGEYVTYEWSDGTDDGLPIDARKCARILVGWQRNVYMAETNTATYTARGNVRSCDAKDQAVGSCENVLTLGATDIVGSTLDPQRPGWIAIDVTAANAGNALAQVSLYCLPTVASGGSGGGDLNPASGVDTVFALGENITQGTNSVGLNIKSTTDVIHDIDRWIGRAGQTGQRVMTAFLDDTAHNLKREAVSWDTRTTQPSSGTAITSNGTALSSITGGKLRAEALSIRAQWTNTDVSGDGANRCDWRVATLSERTIFSMDTASLDEYSGDATYGTFQYCGTSASRIRMGTGGDNSSAGGFCSSTSDAAGAGSGACEVANQGTGYIMPLSDCVCADATCRIFVVAQEWDLTTNDDLCESINDVVVSVWLSEDYP